MSAGPETRRSRRAREARRAAADPGGRQPPAGWKAFESLWVVLCAVSFGFAGPWILLWVSTRARRPWWMLAAVVFCAAYITAFWMMDTGGLIRRDGYNWLLFFCWLGTTAFAVHVQPEYLHIKWERRLARQHPTDSARGRRRSAGSASPGDISPSNASASGTSTGSGASGNVAAADAAAGAEAPRRDDAGSRVDTGAMGSSAAAGTGAAVLDINSADSGELAALPGMTPELAQQAVELRRERGPFRSVEQFASDLSLQPHVYARLRGRLACRAASAAPPAFGRRVDY